MSFIKKGLAAIGIGGAKIDTKVYNNEVKVGEFIEGDLIIQGGNVDQEINEVTICVRSIYDKEVDDNKVAKTVTHQEYLVKINRVISAKENINIPFKFKLSNNVPVSSRRFPVYLQTQLDIQSGADNFDKDYIQVIPNEYMNVILNSIEQLGFSLRSIESEYINSAKYSQEYEFTPNYNCEFKRNLDELELVMKPNDYGIDIHLEVDRRARGIGGFLENMFDIDESQLRFNFSYDKLKDSNYIKSEIYNIIIKYAR